MAMYARGNPATWWKGRSCGGPNRAPTAMFISPFRRITSLGTLTVLVVLLGGAWYATSPKRISRLSEALLSNLLGGKVTVKSGHLSLSGTLLLSGVKVETGGGGAGPGGGASLPIFSADQIEARFDWISLLAGELRATQLTAIRPTLYLVEDRTAGRWNYEMLQTRRAETNPSFSSGAGRRVPLPVIVMRDARVQWGEFRNDHVYQTASATVDGQFTPTPGSPYMYRFQVAQRADESVSSWNAADAGTPYAGFNVTGTWDVANNKFTAATQEIVLSDALKNTLPGQVRQWWTEHDLHGRFSQLWMSFDKESGLVMGADLDRVSMNVQVTPSPTSGAYNVNLSDVRGTLVFGVSKMSVTAHLRGELLGYAFLADAEIAGAQPDSAFNLHLRFPHAVLGDSYPPLFMAFPDSQDLLQRIEPHGKFDLTLGVTRPAGSTAFHLDGKILCEDARMRFGPFPFPLQHVKGLVLFNENTVTFQKVTAQADEHVVHIEGTTGTTPQNKLIDFKVWADDATFDDRLAASLPQQFKAIWNQFQLIAKGSFSCEVKRADEPGAEPSIRVEVALRDGAGYAKMLPYRFSHLQGKFILTQDQTRIDDLRLTCGEDGSGRVRFDGFIRHPGGDVSNLMPDLQVKADVPIDAKLLNALPEEYTDPLKAIALAGRAKFDGSVRTGNGVTTKPAEESPAGLQVAGKVAMIDGAIKARDGAWDLEHVGIAGMLADGRLRLQDAHATAYGSLQLSADGDVDLKGGTARLTLGAHAADFLLPTDAPRVLPPAALDAWNAYKPAGRLDIDAQAKVQVSHGAEQSEAAFTVDGYSCTLVPKDLAISNAAWPESVHGISGMLQIVPGKITFQQLAGQTGPVSVRCDGWYETASGACSLTGVATSEGLPGGWTSKLPASVSQFLQAHKATGQLRVAVRKLERGSRAEPLAFDATVGAKTLSIDDSLDLTADDISLQTSGNWSDKAFDFSGVLNGTNVGISGKRIDSLVANVTMASKDQTLKIEDLDGKVAGGTVQGGITMQFAGGGAGYQANVVLHDAQLHRLLLPPSATEEERKRIGDGRVSATLSLQQTFGEHADRTGRGELVVQDGTIYNVPLAMGLMQLVTLRLPVARAFDHAAMSYYIRDNKVTFERILLESPSINLAGAGTLSLKEKALDLNFVTESPNELRLPLISTIINEIRLELLQLSVTGTVDNPRITPVPLSPIASSLQALLPHRKTASEQ